MGCFEKRSSETGKKRDADWTRTPAALFASAVLGVAAISGLAWSWNRTIERDARVVSQPTTGSTTGSAMGSATGMTRSSLPEPASMSAIKRIDLNTASVGELDLLPRIGPALAARIIADREENGPYDSIDELERVSGIGPKTIEKLRSRVILSTPGNDSNRRASASADPGG